MDITRIFKRVVVEASLLANFEVLDISFFFNKLKEIGTTKRLSKTASEKMKLKEVMVD